MKVDGTLGAWQTAAVIGEARRHENAGYDGLWTSESAHDPFLPLVLAAEHSERIELGTAIAVAFARSPMQLAYTAHDLQAYSGGRFTLGLGSQIRPHIERRFSMPWSHPAPRCGSSSWPAGDLVAWNDGTKLRFRGFYSHTLMTPFFAPPPGGAPKVFLAAVGEVMTAVARGRRRPAVHAFSTERYLRRSPPGPGLAARAAARQSQPCSSSRPAAREEMARAIAGTREQIAFYGSTPAYRGCSNCTAGPGWPMSSTSCPDRRARTNGRPWPPSSATTC